MGRVLIIEDEEVLRRAMVRALAKLPDVEAVGAGNLTDALVSIDDQFPDLILSDLDLPDRSGIELIGEIAGRGLAVPIVFISAYLEAYGSQIPPHAGVRVLEKPVALDELRRLVLEQLRGVDPEGQTAPFSAVDYLQLAGMGGHSVEIAVNGPGGGGGVVFVHRGEIWHAEDEEGDGRDALNRLLNLKPAAASCRASSARPGPRSLEGRWEELILEAARHADESGNTGGDESLDFDLDRAFGADTPDGSESAPEESAAPDDGFDAVMERGLEALLEKDYDTARAAFHDAQTIRPDDRVVEANLKRLSDMGFGRSGEPEAESE